MQSSVLARWKFETNTSGWESMRILWIILATALVACELPVSNVVDGDAGNADASVPDMGEGTFGAAQVIFDYGDWTIPSGGEQSLCAQWTLNNDEPLYVNGVIQANDGGFHHSNWYAVRDDQFVGEDGFFTCATRGFAETSGAIFGEVVFAQSTQAYVEDQRFPEGVAIKIPPRSKIIGGVHLLNVGSAPLDTGVRMGLELVHPRDVKVVATPWRMDNSSLAIPGEKHSRWSSSCTKLKVQYEIKNDESFAPLIYWILPHYHGLGDYFRVDVLRPEGDETIVELAGFNAEANGVTFPEPIDMAGATGMRMVCGYTNPYDRYVYYGLKGADEMCTMLAFTNAAMRLNTSVWEQDSVDESEGFETHHGTCSSLFLPKNQGQQMPTPEEIDAELYVPESNTDGDIALVPDCEDTPTTAEPSGAVTLSSLRVDVFATSCAYSSCHDADAPAAGLDLTARDLYSELLNHEMLTAAGMPLVSASQPEQSWLYRVMSSCQPATEAGFSSPMPRNSPRLLSPGQVARVRDWIATGARDN